MTRAVRHAWTLAALASTALAISPGCGGANKGEPAASPKMAPAHLEAAPASDRDGDASHGPAGPSPAPRDRESLRFEARDALARAQLELEASSSDCAAACRALGSLERAVSRLCELAESPDDRRRCEDAKQKLGAARDRVRQTCNACPGGPTLDPRAPSSSP